MESNSPVNNTTTSTSGGTGNWYTAAPGGGTGRGPGYALPGHVPTSQLNRQEQRTQAKVKKEQFFGRLKPSKTTIIPGTPAHQAFVDRIKAKTQGKEPGGANISRAATQSMVEMIRDSLAGLYGTLNNYWPAFPGASAAETCDANVKDCVNPWPTIDELREFANKLGYALRVSHGVIARKDRSLKGVAVIIADHDHTNSEIQREISQFVDWPKPGNKFKILTEVDSDLPQWASSLCSKNFNRLDCIPVDLPGRGAKKHSISLTTQWAAY